MEARIEPQYALRLLGAGEKAAATLALVEHFLNDAVNLYQTMSGNTWR